MQTTNQLMEQAQYLHVVGNYDALINLLSGDILEQHSGLHTLKAKAYYNLAKSYDEQQKPEDAVAAYQKSLELDPGFDCAHYNLATTYYYDLGQYSDAFVAYSQYLATTKDGADSCFRQAALSNMSLIQMATKAPAPGSPLICEDHICQVLPALYEQGYCLRQDYI